ncbi:MAG: hypothetical protein ACI4FO_02375 [Acutalibacteraceae bacterium]
MMRLKELFSIPKNGNISDASFMVRISFCFAGILLFMLSLCVTAYAMFSYNVGSGTTKIQAANFDLDVKITDLSKPDEPPVTGGYDYRLVSGTHKVTLTAEGNASTGYCKIALIDDSDNIYETHYTAQFGKGEVFEFTIYLSADTNINFTPQWGTYSGEPDIQNGGSIGESVEVIDEPIVTQSQTEPVTQPATQPATQPPTTSQTEPATKSAIQ